MSDKEKKHPSWYSLSQLSRPNFPTSLRFFAAFFQFFTRWKWTCLQRLPKKIRQIKGWYYPVMSLFQQIGVFFGVKKNKIQIHLSGDASQKGGGHVINSFSPSCRSFCLSSWFSLLSHGKDFSGRISTQSSNITVSELSSILVLKLTNHVFSKKKQISVCFKKNCS